MAWENGEASLLCRNLFCDSVYIYFKNFQNFMFSVPKILRKFFDSLNNIFMIIVEYLLRVGVRFVHSSLLLLWYLVRITYLLLFIFFFLALISHLILCILCTICCKPNWNKSLITIIITISSIFKYSKQNKFWL